MNELEKWAAVHPNVVVITEFLDWLECRTIPIVLAQRHLDGECLIPPPKMHSELIYEHFDIDPAKLERERKEMLAEFVKLRAEND